MKIIALFTAVGLVAACDLDVGDLNNPSIDDLEKNPTVASVTAASTGLLIGNRRNVAAANGYISELGILGRESYNFDTADPRFIGELLQGKLNPGSPFGGNFWTGPYANIKLANTIQRVVDNVAEFSAEERSSIKGFSKTIEALDLLEVLNAHDTNGGVIDTDRPLDGALGAVVGKPQLIAEIARLLDEAAADLAAGGEKFPFALSNGYEGFDTPVVPAPPSMVPTSFLQFNRAVRARVAVYAKDYPAAITALGMSFVDEMPMTQADLDLGVFHSFSTGSGDAVNNLINPNIYAHPSVRADAMAGDLRLARKVGVAKKAGSGQGLTSVDAFSVYVGPAARVPIIRNEELLLLLAEARFFTNDVPGAYMALNAVRTTSGGLAALTAQPDMAMFVDQLLYERRYSLLFEGHRWIDLRRFMKPLPLDMPDHEQNVRYPLPLSECNARPGDPACMLGST